MPTRPFQAFGHEPPGRTYFVDATLGLDANCGTAGYPLQTIAAVNALALKPGDQVLFKRGETWVDQSLIVPASGAPGRPITFGAYGTGANPIIDGSRLLTGWAIDTGAIYKITSFTDATNNYRAVFENGVRLIRKTSYATLAVGSFFLDDPNNILYVWCTDGGDPATKTMRFTSKQDCVDTNAKSWLVFDGIDATMAYYSGYECRRDGGHDIRVRNCTSSWNTQRNFNAGAWALGIVHDRVIFENCTAHDSVGEGFWIGYGNGCGAWGCTSYNNSQDRTAKGYSGAVAVAGCNFTIGSSATNCFLRHCTAYEAVIGSAQVSVEYVVAEGNQPVNTVIDNCLIYRTAGAVTLAIDMGINSVFTNNIMYCASTAAIGVILKLGDNSGVSSTGVVVEHNTLATYVPSATQLVYGYLGTNGTFKNNLYYGGGGAGKAYYIEVAYQTGFTSDYNEWSLPGTSTWQPAHFYSFADWKTNVGQDAHSRNDADPVFVGTTDFHLQVTSPCIGAGDATVGVVNDYDGVPRGVAVDIGAYEHV